ncbi:MAG: MBL fold metallo-hydrolase [Elusimicrobia bacterium]|nr:MBL fold metallo-hydrolase [Elusimicrobiota bacterium]
MRITCWGARGSIAVSGKDYLVYGGDTTCLEIQAKNGDTLVVDSGSGIRRLGDRLLEQGRTELNLIFTHAHWDHIQGFPFFKPLYSERAKIRLFGCPFAQDSVRTILAKVLKAPYFPVNLDDVKASIAYNDSCVAEFDVGPVHVAPVLLSHPNQGLGYKFTEDGKSFVFLTDNELGYRHLGGLTMEEYVKFCSGAELLFHDAQYTPEEYRHKKGWGHSVYIDALDLATRAGVRRFGLFHHDQDRADAKLQAVLTHCHTATSGSGPECFAVAQDSTFDL